MSDTSPILALPLIQPAQAQKHVTHNEALRLLDVLVQAAVLTRGDNAPPATPAAGDRHIVGPSPTGAWAGQSERIAVWEDPGGWFFLAPAEGWTVHVIAADAAVTFIDGQWAAMADRALRVARLGIGTDADTTNRLAVVSPATLLTHNGAGHQVKVNKAAAGDTASLLFQTGFSGRAEMGTTQSDDFRVKVSSDGLLFRDGLSVAAATGVVSLPQGVLVADGVAAAPGLGFAADTDTGLTRPGNNQIGLVTGGTQRVLVTNSAVSSTLPVQAPNGTASAPSVSFSGDTNTGMLSAGADQIGWSTGGTQRLLLSNTALTPTVPVLAPAGSAAAPSLSFSGDTNTGLFSAAADTVGWAVNGTERARLTATGLRLGNAGSNPGAALDVRGEGVPDAVASVTRSSEDNGGPFLRLRKSRGTTAVQTVPLLNDTLGTLNFGGLETGTTYTEAAAIVAVALADFATGATPARLSLRTAAIGTNVLAERVRIDETTTQITGRLSVNGAVANGTAITIADDAAASFAPGRTGGFLLMTAGGGVGATVTFEPHSAMIVFDVGSTAAFCARNTAFAGGGGSVDCVTGTALTGTTGTDGNVTVSARTDGTLTVENRRGASTTFTLWVF
jgi:hypothetical protein